MDKCLVENLNEKLIEQGILLKEEQKQSLLFICNEYIQNQNLLLDVSRVKELEQKIYELTVEVSSYREILDEKFLAKNHQTIAHLVGRLTIDFFKNPFKNFITPKSLLSIYAEYLKRLGRRHPLTNRQIRLVNKYCDDSELDMNFSPFDESVLKKGKELTKQVSAEKKKLLHTDLTHKKAHEIKVALILDEFSFNSFKDEFDAIILTPNNWKQELLENKPDLFFCESAWSGVDSNERPWKGKIYASKNFAKENRQELLGILDFCAENGIPTIFWNKEDPTHYADRVHDFIKTAVLFDFVFTTDEGCVEKYKSEYFLEHVFSLPFATNPRIFNPITTKKERGENVVFAGSWYNNHQDRSLIMTNIFETLVKNGYELDFYNRYYKNDDPNHIIPIVYQKFEKPSVSNIETAGIYKSTKYGLNINTVSNSKTMFARRVFELMSSNTLVLSNYSIGMDEFFGSNVIFLDKDPARLINLTSDEIDKIREENLNKVLKYHTYKNRFSYILKSANISYNQEVDQLTIVLKVDSQEQAKSEIYDFYKNFKSENKKLLLIVSNKIKDVDVQDFYINFNSSNINVISESYILNYFNSNSNSSFIETPYFIIAKTLGDITSELVEKALIHSVYTLNNYVSLNLHHEGRYFFEKGFIMNNIFTSKINFMTAFENFNKKVSLDIYYIEGKNNEY